MSTWQLRLTKLVRWGKELPDPLGQMFTASRPLASPWPAAIPTAPALQEFYRLCNGGWFAGGLNLYQFLLRGKLAGEARRWRGRLWDVTADDRPLGNRALVLEFDDIGGLAWDPDADRLYHFQMDDGAAEPLPDASLEEFFRRLFDPARAEGELAAEWSTALRWLDARAEPGTAAGDGRSK